MEGLSEEMPCKQNLEGRGGRLASRWKEEPGGGTPGQSLLVCLGNGEPGVLVQMRLERPARVRSCLASWVAHV